MATIRDANITGDFVHEPLRDPGSEIRLISVKAFAEQEDDIECTISTHAIDEAPPYAAISYTWGSMSDRRSIKLNGKRLGIGQNSWTVLWQVRLHEIAVPVWIDVLSIDQANDVEKSIQVGIMGIIYKTAQITFVSLGSHEDDSDLLAEQIIAHTDHIEDMRDLCTGSEDQQVEPLTCTSCRSLLTHRIYRCLQCGESVRFCQACEGAHHDGAKHDVYPDRSLENKFQGQCVECRQPISLRWCEPKHSSEGHLSKVCKKCAQVHLDEPHGELWRSDYVLTDEYGPLTQPVGYNASLQRQMETYARFFELSQEAHQRLIDALRSLSLRAYFNRLWIIQEIRQARTVIIACGDSLIRYEELAAVAYDLSSTPTEEEMKHRWSTMDKRAVSWFLEVFLSDMDRGPMNSTIWNLASLYRSSNCFDPRDRVFGLLALADTASFETIRPDYTKSVTEVLLQLIEHKAARDVEIEHSSLEDTFGDAYSIIGGFGLGPESPDIADMLQRRRANYCRNKSGPSPVQRDLIREPRKTSRIVLVADSYCRVSANEAGHYVVPLLEQRKMTQKAQVDDDSTVQFPDALRIIRNPAGAVAALATNLIQPSDILLFFQVSARRQIPQSIGLVVRALEGKLHSIVGQFIFNSRYEPCSGNALATRGEESRGPSYSDDGGNAEIKVGGREDSWPQCPCGGEPGLHSREGWGWKVHLSPEDLLLFIAQDLKLEEHEPPGKYIAPMVDLAVYPRERAKRVITDVTSEPLSSYAVCEDEVCDESRKSTNTLAQMYEL